MTMRITRSRDEKWTMPPWMEKYRDLIVNTGGNPVEDLMNDDVTTSFDNVLRYALICSVSSQVALLELLHKKGLLA